MSKPKMVKVAEYETEMADFIVYVLKNSGIKAESQPLIHSAKDEFSRIIGEEAFKGWNPNRAVVVPAKDKDVAEEIIGKLAELNWYEKKPKTIDVTMDVYPQLYGIKPWSKKKKKKKRRKKK
jgi:hypothetical protein